MGLFSRIAERHSRRWGMALMGLAALWGVRTPPEPTVVAQMSPRKGPEGSAPEDGEERLDGRLSVELPETR